LINTEYSKINIFSHPLTPRILALFCNTQKSKPQGCSQGHPLGASNDKCTWITTNLGFNNWAFIHLLNLVFGILVWYCSTGCISLITFAWKWDFYYLWSGYNAILHQPIILLGPYYIRFRNDFHSRMSSFHPLRLVCVPSHDVEWNAAQERVIPEWVHLDFQSEWDSHFRNEISFLYHVNPDRTLFRDENYKPWSLVRAMHA